MESIAVLLTVLIVIVRWLLACSVLDCLWPVCTFSYNDIRAVLINIDVDRLLIGLNLTR